VIKPIETKLKFKTQVKVPKVCVTSDIWLVFEVYKLGTGLDPHALLTQSRVECTTTLRRGEIRLSHTPALILLTLQSILCGVHHHSWGLCWLEWVATMDGT
jgi:hypothetical protein